MSVSELPLDRSVPGIPAERRLADRGAYLDACATTPPAESVLEAMAEAQRDAWANPSSLHGHGLAAAESLERSRLSMAASLGCGPEQVILTSFVASLRGTQPSNPKSADPLEKPIAPWPDRMN